MGTGKEKGVDSTPETTDEKCPKCGKPMVVRSGRFGKFLACSAYPKCKTTKKIVAGNQSTK
jgi:DNA topoisomerase-1